MNTVLLIIGLSLLTIIFAFACWLEYKSRKEQEEQDKWLCDWLDRFNAEKEKKCEKKR